MSAPHFGTGYSTWKGWDEGAFGQADASRRQYFAAELRNAGIRPGPGVEILEIGFGNGALLAYLAGLGASVCGTEANAELVARARACGFEASASLSLDDFAPRRFDAVVALDVLEHVPQHELPALLARIARLLKPGGRFLARFPNGDSPLGLSIQNGDVTHCTFIGSAKARHLFVGAGLDVARLGKPARPMIDRNPVRTVHNLTCRPVRAVIERIAKLLFFPGSEIHFFSSNLVVVGVARPGGSG